MATRYQWISKSVASWRPRGFPPGCHVPTNNISKISFVARSFAELLEQRKQKHSPQSPWLWRIVGAAGRLWWLPFKPDSNEVECYVPGDRRKYENRVSTTVEGLNVRGQSNPRSTRNLGSAFCPGSRTRNTAIQPYSLGAKGRGSVGVDLELRFGLWWDDCCLHMCVYLLHQYQVEAFGEVCPFSHAQQKRNAKPICISIYEGTGKV